MSAPHYPSCPTHRAHSGWLIPVRECEFCKGYAFGVSAARDAVSALMSAPSDSDPTPFDFFLYEEVLPVIDRL